MRLKTCLLQLCFIAVAMSGGGEAIAAPKKAATKGAAPSMPWKRSVTTDTMTDQPIVKLRNISTNTVSMGFPYQGAQHGTLLFRRDPREGDDLLFYIERGQFMCDDIALCTVWVRFGDKAPVEWPAAQAEDGSSDILFLRDIGDFVSELKGVETIVIEATFFQEGDRQFKFRVNGFNRDDLNAVKP